MARPLRIEKAGGWYHVTARGNERELIFRDDLDWRHFLDMVLYLGRRVCGMKLAELAEAVGLRNYAVVGTNARRYEQWLGRDRTEQARMKEVTPLLNCKM